MSARLRDLAVEDLPHVWRLLEQVFAEYGFADKLAGVEDDVRESRARYAAPRAGFWVADDGGTVVGTVAIRPEHGPTCELKRLYLQPGQRGRGLGQALYEHAEAFARAAGYERVRLVSSRRFAEAHRLYRRNGFVLVERIDNDWEDDVFQKELGAE